jgi:DnaJ-domain-containing protein 1
MHVCREQPTFDIDYRHLDQSYRALQFKLHPDKFGLASKVRVAFLFSDSISSNLDYQDAGHRCLA